MRNRLVWCVAACAALVASARGAAASPAVVGDVTPTEVRVAFARTPTWTTFWTSVRVDNAPGPFALVLPLPDGAFVDQSSDAWFEALEVATAPRVFPPAGLNPYCPGESGPANPFDIAGSVAHPESAPPQVIALAADAAAVSAWASAQGLTLGPDLQSALASVSAAKFLCVRYTAPGVPAVTPTLRVTAPPGPALLPFSITRASSAGLRVSAWFFGKGRAALDGVSTTAVPAGAIAWNAKTGGSTYEEHRDELLTGQPDGASLESASHDALVAATPIANGSAFIDPVALTYFDRASAYGNAAADPDPCIDAAKTALTSAKIIGFACPRGDLASLAGTCVAQPPAATEIDPAALLCGPGADDLALAMTGLAPADTWLTRRTFVIAPGAAGKDRTVSFSTAAKLLPVLQAGAVDLNDCFGGAGGGEATSSSSSSSTSTSGAGGASSSTSSSGGPSNGAGNNGAGNNGSGNGGSGNYGGQGGSGVDDPTPYIEAAACACGSTVDTGSVESGSASGDSCGGDTTGTTAASGDDCGGDTASSSGDACGGDTSGGAADSCSGDSSGDCTVGRGAGAGRRRNGPRLSVLTLVFFGLLLPLRRRGTRKRKRVSASLARRRSNGAPRSCDTFPPTGAR